jgi:hypothetical protein
LYGVRGFLEDVDAGREYWREGSEGRPTVVAAALANLAGPAWTTWTRAAGGDLSQYNTPHAFRNRLMLTALEEVLKSLIALTGRR